MPIAGAQAQQATRDLAAVSRVAYAKEVLHVESLDEVRAQRDDEWLSECLRLGMGEEDGRQLLAWASEQARCGGGTYTSYLRDAIRSFQAGHGLPFQLDAGGVDHRPSELLPEDFYAR